MTCPCAQYLRDQSDLLKSHTKKLGCNMIEVQNLSRYYGDFAAIFDISFSIQQHEIIGFLGLNGAGKSTTLKILVGLLSPSEGQVFINGSNWIENPDAFRNIGFLPEEPPLYKEMTVREFLRYLAKLRQFFSEVDSRIDTVLDLCQIGQSQPNYRRTLFGLSKACWYRSGDYSQTVAGDLGRTNRWS